MIQESVAGIRVAAIHACQPARPPWGGLEVCVADEGESFAVG
jgi:hypothetical protein